MLKDGDRVNLYYRDKWQECVVLTGRHSVIFQDVKTERQIVMKTHEEVKEYEKQGFLKLKLK